MRNHSISFLLLLSLTACQREDFDDIMRTQQQQQDQLTAQTTRLLALEATVKGLNNDIKILQQLSKILEEKISITSYTTTATGYQLVLSNGALLNLSHGTDGKDGKDGDNGTDGKDGQNGANGKDGIQAPVVGIKMDTDGKYYWTLGGSFILQNGEKLAVMGKDGQNGSAGINGVTPLVRTDTLVNQWLISYDGGDTWQVVRDQNGIPTPLFGPQGAAGPQGPSGISGFSIEKYTGYIIIIYNGVRYMVPTAI